MAYQITESLRIGIEEIMLKTLGNEQQFRDHETVRRVYDRIVHTLQTDMERSNLVGAGTRHEGKSINELREFLTYQQHVDYFRKGIRLIYQAIDETSRSQGYLCRDDPSDYADFRIYCLNRTLAEHEFDMNTDR